MEKEIKEADVAYLADNTSEHDGICAHWLSRVGSIGTKAWCVKHWIVYVCNRDAVTPGLKLVS